MNDKCKSFLDFISSDNYFGKISEISDNKFHVAVKQKAYDYDETVKVTCLPKTLKVDVYTEWGDLILSSEDSRIPLYKEAIKELGSKEIDYDTQQVFDNGMYEDCMEPYYDECSNYKENEKEYKECLKDGDELCSKEASQWWLTIQGIREKEYLFSDPNSYITHDLKKILNHLYDGTDKVAHLLPLEI